MLASAISLPSPLGFRTLGTTDTQDGILFTRLWGERQGELACLQVVTKPRFSRSVVQCSGTVKAAPRRKTIAILKNEVLRNENEKLIYFWSLRSQTFSVEKIRFHLNRSQFFNLRHLSKLFSSLAPIRRLLRRLLRRWKAVKVKAGKLMKSEKTVIRWNDLKCDFFEWMFKWVGGRRLDLSFTMNMNVLLIWTKPIPVNLSVLWSNLLILLPSSHHLHKK